MAQTSNKKRNFVPVCVSRSGGAFSSVGSIFSKEKAVFLYKNPCAEVSNRSNVFGADCSKWFLGKYGARARGVFVIWYLGSGNSVSSHLLEERDKELRRIAPLYVGQRKKCRSN